MYRKSQIDPIKLLHLMATYGSKRQAEQLLGLAERSLDTIISRPQNWRLDFAVEAGLRVYRVRRARRFAR
jgi:hypothetical protein